MVTDGLSEIVEKLYSSDNINASDWYAGEDSWVVSSEAAWRVAFSLRHDDQ